jgi:hypothetical protein
MPPGSADFRLVVLFVDPCVFKGDMTSRRNTAARPGQFLDVSLETGADQPIEGKIVGMSDDCAGVVLSEQAAADLCLDQIVQLAFHTLASIDPLYVQARVDDVGLDDGYVDLSFAFDDERECDLPGLLQREFNRRGAPRVTPGALIDVEVILPEDDAPITTTMIDISPDGIGLHWKAGVESAVAVNDVIELAFVLPDSVWHCRVGAELRAARPTDGGLILHIAFEPLAEASCKLSRQAIHGFVVRRWDEHA